MSVWNEYSDYAGTCGTCGSSLQLRVEKVDTWQGPAGGTVRRRVVECASKPEHAVKPS